MSARPEQLWHLRPMTALHLPEVLQIERRAYPFPWTEGILTDCLKVGYSAWVVNDPPGAILGYAFMSMAVGEAHVLNLCVDPPYHQQGLGRFLLAHLTRIATAAGMDVMLLEVRKSNTAAISLYLTAGFHKLGVRKNYYPAAAAMGGAEDAWLLGRSLRSGVKLPS